MRDKPSEMDRVRILMQDGYNQLSWSFFTHYHGNSWHGKDAHLIFWVITLTMEFAMRITAN